MLLCGRQLLEIVIGISVVVVRGVVALVFLNNAETSRRPRRPIGGTSRSSITELCMNRRSDHPTVDLNDSEAAVRDGFDGRGTRSRKSADTRRSPLRDGWMTP